MDPVTKADEQENNETAGKNNEHKGVLMKMKRFVGIP